MKLKPKDINQKDWDAVESPEISDEMFSQMKPAKFRGPQKTPLKAMVSIRLSPEVVTYFKGKGKGWQTQIDNILKEHVEKNQPQSVEP